MAKEDQQKKIIKLLQTAQMLADDLQEGVLSNLIERAIDHAKHGVFSPNVKQAPHPPGGQSGSDGYVKFYRNPEGQS
jgi:hypothetical protein